MTQKFAYTFQKANCETVVLKKTVTDRMEERDAMKAGYAAHYFNKVLRESYGFHKDVVTAWRIEKI